MRIGDGSPLKGFPPYRGFLLSQYDYHMYKIASSVLFSAIYNTLKLNKLILTILTSLYYLS